MNITRFSIQKPIGISMIVMLFVVLGLFSFYRIGVELLPAINIPYVTVTVNYPGAGTEQVEQDVIKPLEDSLSSLSNLKHMTSVARPEKAQITLEFEFWANVDTSAIDATQYVNRTLSKLPTGIQTPTVIKRDVNAQPILEIAVIADKPLADVYTLANDVFVERLQRASGVSDVQIYGGRDKEIAVEVDKDKLSYFNISMNQIATRINQENVLTPAGSVFNNNTETNVRLTAQYTSPEELATIHVTNAKGVNIPLSSLATVKEQDQRVTRYARTNGQEAISLTVYKNSDANLVDTAKATKEQLDSLRAEYPDYQFILITDAATYVQDSLHNTLEALIEGLFTTGLVLFLFLRGWRSTAAVLIAIPTSLISTFFVMYMAGFTFNMMSLMGMSLCIGILVDDSIVVLENIHRHLIMGKEAKVAAEEGRMEIGMAAIAITLCDVVVFMPIAFMNGMTGQYFRQFGLTIVFATICSLFVSFTLTPMLASRFFKTGVYNPQGRIWNFMDRLEQGAIEKYERLLHWSFVHPQKVVVAVTVIFLGAVALVPTGIIGAEYMPKTDESTFRINLQFPAGQNIDKTNNEVRKIEDYLTTVPEVDTYLSSVGSPAGNYGGVSVKLVDRKERDRSVWQVTDQVRGFLRQNFPQAITQVSETQSSVAGVSGGTGTGGGGPNNSPVQIEIRGSSLENIIKASYRVQDILAKIKGVKDVRSSYSEGAPELRLVVDREKVKFYNTTVNQINSVFSGAMAGTLAGYFANDPNNNNQNTDIYVRLKGSDGFKASDIRSIPVQAGNGLVRLGDVARVEDSTGPVMLRRVDKQESINIGANITDRPLQEVLNEIAQNIKPDDLGQNVTYRFTGQADNMKTTFGEMAQALVLSLILVYMLLATLYESVSTPFIRMFSLPFGLIGSLFFLAVTRNTINLYTLIGILVMDGVVAKNGTLLLDYTLTLMGRGIAAKEAVIEAGKHRLKPIFMTSLTMIIGMLPTALAMTAGSETRVGMAWVVIGGLITSTFFTLIAIPIIFLYFENHPLSKWMNFAAAMAVLKAHWQRLTQ
ncbi:efflux RND transporter permease subunit [Sporomusa acidovorans]|uniref:Swarming motility protein SwrC n=1 Tax=Sporomusa acidovorans (strain ATCC 49682 / DSM 3132 / Mol) TaxID=1123286 RepID=A0ABZ3J7M0_SPOA4|nr:efflux RND transporter permease subunit [Sporomusa acidovorans]OZC21280.1 efflux pump membrane transporter BepE [Sporomusa acidovorans DSM 3132]SDE66856.1 hydrophobe/amphiphile efflux-1 (HAE1) family protein [Sporomusa acidovorans]